MTQYCCASFLLPSFSLLLLCPFVPHVPRLTVNLGVHSYTTQSACDAPGPDGEETVAWCVLLAPLRARVFPCAHSAPRIRSVQLVLSVQLSGTGRRRRAAGEEASLFAVLCWCIAVLFSCGQLARRTSYLAADAFGTNLTVSIPDSIRSQVSHGTFSCLLRSLALLTLSPLSTGYLW